MKYPFSIPFRKGIQSIDGIKKNRFTQHNPFIALKDFNTEENQDNVYGFSLVYSENC
ncbi:glycoside hydrolase family 36 N-terminal domain-containing protein [Tepidibacillus fermentans]|uniref:glycoside hydrolase family 36 N-terminal domain-containing protein n=1 Tax=Tepidibacillus fermentans TaxID=1281767 RepID=UPI001046BBC2